MCVSDPCVCDCWYFTSRLHSSEIKICWQLMCVRILSMLGVFCCDLACCVVVLFLHAYLDVLYCVWGGSQWPVFCTQGWHLISASTWVGPVVNVFAAC